MSNFLKPEAHRRPSFNMTTQLGASKPESERDSGFSDASSEYLSTVDLTDSEDTGKTKVQVNQEQSSHPVTVMGGSYPGLSSMIIMNNFILKQQNTVAASDKHWGFPSSMEMMPQSQVVLLQPMVSNNTSSPLKTTFHSGRESKNYLPVLKSYPRIAPYPAESPAKSLASSELRTTSAPEYVHVPRHRRHHHGHRPHCSTSSLSGLQKPVKTRPSFESADTQADVDDCQELHDSSSSLAAKPGSLPSQPSQPSQPCQPHELTASEDASLDLQLHDAFCIDDKLKRFSNTYNILNRSGLLGITLRTKQLIKENRRTQSQLHQLQEQTALLMEALKSGDPQLWTRLQLVLQETAPAQSEEEPCRTHQSITI